MEQLDQHFLAPARLKLATTLTAVSEAEFITVRDHLGVSDSVLSKHVASLESVDYIRRRKGTHQGRRTTWLALTNHGRDALKHHVAALRTIINTVD
jgi:DNA-binding MarR family transcriptional regulator